jgi:DNA-binding MarR family transcriptional regulator
MPKVTIMPDLCRCDLHQDAVIMAICIAKYAKYGTMTAFPSNRTLMRETRFNRARLNRTKRLMTEANIMTIETRYDDAGDMTSNLYTLNNKFIRLGHESGGVTVDTEILSSELTAKEVALLLTIAWGASNKTANPTNKAICEAMGIGAAMLTALKNSLIEKGMIECEPSFKDGKGQTANKITIVANCISPPCENRTYPPTKIDPPPPRKTYPPPPRKSYPPPPRKSYP